MREAASDMSEKREPAEENFEPALNVIAADLNALELKSPGGLGGKHTRDQSSKRCDDDYKLLFLCGGGWAAKRRN